MTPYKSMLKWVCDRMGAQAHRTHGDFPPLQSMVCYDCRHLLALLCHDPVSRNARHLEKPSSPPPLLAGLHASPLPRAENLRTHVQGVRLNHRLFVREANPAML